MRNIIFLFALIAFSFSNKAFSDEQANTYFIDNVVVNVSGKSPSDARNIAVNSARKDAFLILLARLGIDNKIANKINNDEISDMVRSEQINDEKIAGNNYSATFNILFAKNFVDYTLAKKNDPDNNVEAISAASYLLLPAKVEGESFLLWNENNWKKSIEKTVKNKNLTQFKVIESTIDNQKLIGENLQNTEFKDLKDLNEKYKTRIAFLMFFNYDNIENKVNIEMLRISAYYKQKVKLNFINVDRLSYDELMAKVAEKTIEYILNSEKESAEMSNDGFTKVEAEISNFSDWVTIKNRIEESGLIKQTAIDSISKDRVILSLEKNPSPRNMEDTLKKIGFSVEKRAENFYVID